MSRSREPQQVSLWSSASQRQEFEDLADLYAILRTTEMVERAYARDALETEEYTDAVTKLIQQFKATEKALKDRGAIENLAQFVRKYNVDCPRAVERMTLGAPDGVVSKTSANGFNQEDRKAHMALVRVITELFIHISNLVFLGRTAVDELAPQLEALIKALGRAKTMGIVPQDFEAAALEEWLKTLQSRRASDTFDEQETRQFEYDLNNAKTLIDEIFGQS